MEVADSDANFLAMVEGLDIGMVRRNKKVAKNT